MFMYIYQFMNTSVYNTWILYKNVDFTLKHELYTCKYFSMGLLLSCFRILTKPKSGSVQRTKLPIIKPVSRLKGCTKNM